MATRGRRPAGSDTKEAIVAEAQRQFGERGYPATTLRSVAQGAGVDPRLVLHYFGSKQGLFAASVELPVPAEIVVERVFEGGREQIPERAADLLLTVLDEPRSRRAFTALVRAAVSEPEAAEVVRDVLTTRMLIPIARREGGNQPELRAALMASLVVGIVMARHVVGIGPLVAADPERLRAAIIPVIRHYLEAGWAAADGPSEAAAQRE